MEHSHNPSSTSRESKYAREGGEREGEGEETLQCTWGTHHGKLYGMAKENWKQEQEDAWHMVWKYLQSLQRASQHLKKAQKDNSRHTAMHYEFFKSFKLVFIFDKRARSWMREDSASRTLSLTLSETQTHTCDSNKHIQGEMQLQACTDTEEKVSTQLLGHVFFFSSFCCVLIWPPVKQNLCFKDCVTSTSVQIILRVPEWCRREHSLLLLKFDTMKTICCREVIKHSRGVNWKEVQDSETRRGNNTARYDKSHFGSMTKAHQD